MKACVPTVGLWEPEHLPNQSPSADGGWKLSVSDEHPTLRLDKVHIISGLDVSMASLNQWVEAHEFPDYSKLNQSFYLLGIQVKHYQ